MGGLLQLFLSIHMFILLCLHFMLLKYIMYKMLIIIVLILKVKHIICGRRMVYEYESFKLMIQKYFIDEIESTFVSA